MAARGARAAGRTDAAHRRAHTVAADDAEGQARNAAFLQALQPLGWTVGRNVRIDYRWAAGDAASTRQNAAELVALRPDVVLTCGAAGVAPLLEATQSVPIVFVLVADPVGAGFVDSLARPGGNVTGFIAFEYGFTAKWLELLKEDRAGRDASGGPSRSRHYRQGSASSVPSSLRAPSLGVEAIPVNVRDPSEIERAIAAFARSGNGGLIVTASALAMAHRDLIVALAARHKLPAVYFARPHRRRRRLGFLRA